MAELSENETKVINCQEHGRPVLEGETLMSWTIKAHSSPMFLIDTIMGSIALIPASFIIYIYLLKHPGSNDDAILYSGIFGLCFWLFLWLRGVRQKTVYNYRITDQGGEVEYWEDYPENMGNFFKWLSVTSLIIIVCLIAVDPVFIWGLAGPVGIAVGGAKFFLGWENEKHHRVSSPWNEYNFVTVDRKRKMLVAHRTNLTVGFQIHLSKDLFDEFVDTLKVVLPPTAVFTEAPWSG
ncbi:hypothetical protein [Pseudomonas sp. NA-150]|uniref:hypothetical protein n=1 Tax=Pseudomonas sp. NA-150 TaxID=3367525 RepID=UPI0037C787C2